MTPETLVELQKEAHEIALKTGWWDCQECKGSKVNPLAGLEALDGSNYCRACHATGRAPVDIPDLIGWLHEELSEARKEYRSGRPVSFVRVGSEPTTLRCDDGRWFYISQFGGLEIEWSDQPKKPEGFGIELADFVILLLSIADRLDHRSIKWSDKYLLENPSVGTWIGSMHAQLFFLFPRPFSPAFNTQDMSLLITSCFKQCEVLGIDLEACIRLKMAYNRTRPYRHLKIC